MLFTIRIEVIWAPFEVIHDGIQMTLQLEQLEEIENMCCIAVYPVITWLKVTVQITRKSRQFTADCFIPAFLQLPLDSAARVISPAVAAQAFRSLIHSKTKSSYREAHNFARF